MPHPRAIRRASGGIRTAHIGRHRSTGRRSVTAGWNGSGMGLVSDPVGRRRAQFICKGVAGLLSDNKKAGLRPSPAGALIHRTVEPTLTEPPCQANHWTSQRMTAAAGVSPPAQRDAIAHHLQAYSVQRLSCPHIGFHQAPRRGRTPGRPAVERTPSSHSPARETTVRGDIPQIRLDGAGVRH